MNKLALSIFILFSVCCMYGMEDGLHNNTDKEELFCGTSYQDMEDVWKDADLDIKVVVEQLKNPQRFGKHVSRFLFLYGEPGVGKSTLAKAIAWKAGFYCDFIPSKEILKNEKLRPGTVLYDRLKKGVSYGRPTVVILDKMNNYLSRLEDDGENKEVKLTSAVLRGFLDIHEKNNRDYRTI